MDSGKPGLAAWTSNTNPAEPPHDDIMETQRSRSTSLKVRFLESRMVNGHKERREGEVEGRGEKEGEVEGRGEERRRGGGKRRGEKEMWREEERREGEKG